MISSTSLTLHLFGTLKVHFFRDRSCWPGCFFNQVHWFSTDLTFLLFTIDHIYGCVWKCCVPHCTQWFCWSDNPYEKWLMAVSLGIYPTFSDKPIYIYILIAQLWSLVSCVNLSYWSILAVSIPSGISGMGRDHRSSARCGVTTNVIQCDFDPMIFRGW